MKTEEIRKLTVDEMQKKLKDFKTELFNLRFQHAINQLENPMRIKTVKKNIARILTIHTEVFKKSSALIPE